MHAHLLRGSRERIEKLVSMLPGRRPGRPAHCASANARGCRRRQDAARQPAQNSEADRSRTWKPPSEGTVSDSSLEGLTMVRTGDRFNGRAVLSRWNGGPLVTATL